MTQTTSLTKQTVWKAISSDENTINWFILKIVGKESKYDSSGTGGLNELNENIGGSGMQIGMLRVVSNDKGGSKRVKFIYFKLN